MTDKLDLKIDKGGPTAKSSFRYQDYCSIYFMLDSFLNSRFEEIHCEQGKMDFEIFYGKSFLGYQVKSTATGLSASEINVILKKYSEKIPLHNREENKFFFVFGSSPKNSLNYLLAKLRKDKGVGEYDKRTKKYIECCLKELNLELFKIDHYFFEKDLIESIVFAFAVRILKKYISSDKDVPTETINDFLARLRDEIDKISSLKDGDKRRYSKDDLDSLIRNFLLRVSYQRLEQEGLKESLVKLLQDGKTGIVIEQRIKLQPVNLFDKFEGDITN